MFLKACLRTGVFLVSALTLVALPHQAPAQDVPTIGEGIGAGLDSLYHSVREGRREIAQFNANIAEAREAFWDQFPDGPDIAEAEARFASILREKDLWFLGESLVRTSIEGADAFMGAVVPIIGEVDNGIPRLARPEFGGWVVAVRARAGPAPLFPNLGNALQETQEEYAAYVRARNHGEFLIGPRSPLRSQDPEEYLIGIFMWQPLEARGGHPSYEQARAVYEELGSIVGEAALLAAGRRGVALTKMPDPYFVQEEVGSGVYRAVSPRSFLDDVLVDHLEDTVLAQVYVPRSGPWIESWRSAHRHYETLVQEHGAERVARAAELVARAPIRPLTNRTDGRRSIIDGHAAYGFPSPYPRQSFNQLVRLSPEEFDAAAEAIERAMAAATRPAEESVRVIVAVDDADLLRGMEPLGVLDERVLFALSPRRRTDGFGLYLAPLGTTGDFEVLVFNELSRCRMATPTLGPDGMLYGMLSNRERVLAVDEAGAIFGSKIHQNDRVVFRIDSTDETMGGVECVSAIWRMSPDGSDFQMLQRMTHEVPGQVLYSIPRSRHLKDVVDGADGYLYGVVTEEVRAGASLVSRGRTVGHNAQVVRIDKNGGSQVLHHFPSTERSLRYLTQILLGPEHLYAIVGPTTSWSQREFGQILRMERDGSEPVVLHHFTENRALISRVAVGPDGALYGVAGRDGPRPLTGDGGDIVDYLFRLSTDEGGDIEYYGIAEHVDHVRRTEDLVFVDDHFVGLARGHVVYRVQLPGADDLPTGPQTRALIDVSLESSASRFPPPPEGPVALLNHDTSSVARAQRLLNQLGYRTGRTFGRVDRQTRNAILSFESDRGLEAHGFVTPYLLEILDIEAEAARAEDTP